MKLGKVIKLQNFFKSNEKELSKDGFKSKEQEGALKNITIFNCIWS